MDDKTFDPKTALDWISNVEKGGKRDSDINPRLKAWVDLVSPLEILDIGAGQGIELNRAAAELSRVLKAGGQFNIVTANPSAYSAWKEIFAESKEDGPRFEGTMFLPDGSASHDVLYFYLFDEIKNSLHAAGLEVQKTETFRTTEKSKGQEILISIQGQKITK